MMRIAWIGDVGTDGGVPKLGGIFLRELLDAGVRVDWFTTSRATLESFPWAQHENLQCFFRGYEWDWNTWYGRNPKLAFIASFAKRIRANKFLAAAVVAEHRRSPYDAVLQFSQGELLGLRSYAAELPIILYPQVHAAGELRWCQIEEPLAQRCEKWWWRKFRLIYLRYRSRLQKRDYNLARGVIGVSRRFTNLIAGDYGVPQSRLRVVYHPLDPIPESAERRKSDGTVRLLFVGRISVRKGIEVLVEVIPQLLAEDPALEITIIGGGALWSNYEPLLKDIGSDRCEWVRSAPNSRVMQYMQKSDVLLMPSSYEPGGIVVAEALACGMVLAASDDVGAAEGLEPPVRWGFEAQDPAGFKAAVQAAVNFIRQEPLRARRTARDSAHERFDARAVTASLLCAMVELVGSSVSPAREVVTSPHEA